MGYVQDLTVPKQWFFLNGTLPAANQVVMAVQPRLNGATLQASGTSTSGSTSVVNDTGQTWTVNQFRGMLVTLTNGNASGNVRWIKSNTATQLVASSGTTEPLFSGAVGTDAYQVWAPSTTLSVRPVIREIYIQSSSTDAATLSESFQSVGWATGATAATTRTFLTFTDDTGSTKAFKVISLVTLDWRGIRSGDIEIVPPATQITGNYTIRGYWEGNNLPDYTGGPNS